MQWGFKGLIFGTFHAAIDGRVWYATTLGDRTNPGYYFNGNGQGGQLRGVAVGIPSLVKSGGRSESVDGSSACRSGQDSRGPGVEQKSAGWFAPLDQECAETL